MTEDQILNDATFKTALGNMLGKVSNAKHYSSSAAEALKLAGYYKHELKQTYDQLENYTRKNEYTVGGNPGKFTRLEQLGRPKDFCVFGQALSKTGRLKLLGHLAVLLDFVASKYHAAMLASPDFPDYGDADIIPLRSTDPVKRYAHLGIKRVADNYRNGMRQMFDRLISDWQDIEKLFFQQRNDIGLEDCCLEQLAVIGSSGSDPHKGGKQTYVLFFTTVPMRTANASRARLGARSGSVALVGDGLGDPSANVIGIRSNPRQGLIYKPGDLELDTRIVGNMTVLRQRLESHTWPRLLPRPNDARSLFEVVNANNPGLDLPVYRILPRGCASRVASRPIETDPAKHDKNIPVQEAYGYIEFLAHDPEDPHAADDAAIRDSDYITTHDGHVDRFYRHFGWMIGLGHVIGMADAHEENSRVCRKKLHLIDCEISFKHQRSTAGETKLLQILTKATDKHESILWRKRGNDFSPSFVPIPDDDADAKRILDAAKQGVKEALEYVCTDPGHSFENWLTDRHLDLVVARHTVLGTVFFGQRRDTFWKQAAIRALPNDIDDPNSAAYVQMRKTPAGADPAESRPYIWVDVLKNWLGGDQSFEVPQLTPENDWTCYLNVDYPAHYRRLGSMDLMNARGDAIDVFQPYHSSGQREICGRRWFHQHPAAELFTVHESRPAPTIANLDDPASGLLQLKPHFDDLGIQLEAPTYYVQEPGRLWYIHEDRLGEGFWAIKRMDDGSLWVQLCRNNADRDAAAPGRVASGKFQYSPSASFGTKQDLKSAYKEYKTKREGKFEAARKEYRTRSQMATPSRVDANPKKFIAPFVRDTLGFGVDGRREPAKGERIQRGEQWKLVEQGGSLYWFAQLKPVGTTGYGEVWVSLVRDERDHPAPGAPYAETTITEFAIPRPLRQVDLNNDAVAVMKDAFQQHGIDITGATSHTERNGSNWHIKNGDDVYHLARETNGSVKVSQAMSAIAAARKYRELLVSKAVADRQIASLQTEVVAALTEAAGRNLSL